MWLLLVTGLLLFIAVVGSVLLLRLQWRRAALQRRLIGLRPASIQPSRSATGASLMRRRRERKPTLVERLAALIGFDAMLRDQYKLPWFVVIGAALLTGCTVVLLSFRIVGSLAWLLMPLLTIFGSRTYYASMDSKRRTLLTTQFPDALALIVRAVRVGIPVTESIRAVAREALDPTRGEFNRLQQQIAMGASLEAALREMAERNLLQEYSFFAAALALQAQTGGGLTNTLETLADIIRRRVAVKERGHALSSEARTSSLVLGALPVVTAAMLFVVAPDYIGTLFTDPTGNMILGVAVLSLATGMGTMRLIIRRALS